MMDILVGTLRIDLRRRFRRKSTFPLIGFAILALAAEASAQGVHASQIRVLTPDLAVLQQTEANRVAEPRVSFQFLDTPLPDALARIAVVSRLRLVLADGLIPPDARVTAQMSDVTPAEAFSLVLLGTPLEVVTSRYGFAALVRREPVPRVAGSPPAQAIREPLDDRTGREPALVGMVVDPDGRPIAGAYVRLCGTRQVQLTSDAGRFEFDRVSPGAGGVSASAPGRSEVVRKILTDPAEMLPALRLQAGKKTARLGRCPER